MKAQITKSNRMCTLLITAMTICLIMITTMCQAADINANNQAVKIIKAVVARDYKTILSLKESYPEHIKYIKDTAPSFQWDRKIQEYTQNEIKAISSSSLITLLPRSCDWKLVDVKYGYAGRTWYEIYVRVQYINISEAPIYEDKRVKSTVVTFVINKKGQLVQDAAIFSEENTYWKTNMKVTDLNTNFDGDVSRTSGKVLSGMCIEFKVKGGVPPYKYNFIINDTANIKDYFPITNYEHNDVYQVNNYLRYSVLTNDNIKEMNDKIQLISKITLRVEDSAGQSQTIEKLF